MLFERFKNEAEFRQDFVKPLLVRMGFHGIDHQHGSQEFGKDFVFAELTPFGFQRFYAAQVKHEEKIQQTSSGKITELLDQIRQAFAVPFKLIESAREHHVSAVFVFNCGEITPNAKEIIFQELRRERYGENVHIFDSERLETLNGITTFQQEKNVRSLLLGMISQLHLNVKIWESMIEELPKFSDARGSMLSALENYLTSPFLTDAAFLNTVGQVWQNARIVDTINLRYMLSGGAFTKKEIREQDVETVRRLCPELMVHSLQLLITCRNELEKLKPL